MTPQEIIDAARVLLNDDNPLMPARFSDTDLLGFVNQAVKRVCIVRPDLFIISANITPTVNRVEQELPTNVTRILELNRVVGGNALGEVDKETMDRSAPSWTTETADTPVNWMRHPRNPRKYFLYPRPESGTQIAAEYIEVPDDYALSDSMSLPDSYRSAFVDAVVFLAEAVDNEAMESQRAKAFGDMFMQAFGADMAQRKVVDDEDGAVHEQQARARN